MNRTIGFIGAGNMASAIIGGILQAGICPPELITASNPTEEKLRKLEADYGIHTTQNNREAAEASELLFLCVKPQMMDGVLSELRDVLQEDQTIISIAAGKPLSYYEDLLGSEKRIIRVMPNTPALCGAGMSAVCGNGEMQKAENAGILQDVLKICRSFGGAEVLPERLIDVAGQVAGASPAWIFAVIEALADGAVACGMPRDMAYRFASQGVAGAGKLAAADGRHPGELKDMVTSPAGTTIEGLRVLEERAIRGAFMDAVIAAFEKSKRM